jgi:indole-3-glycerol phosphate synthase
VSAPSFDVLGTIVAATRKRVADARSRVPFAEVSRVASGRQPDAAAFEHALTEGRAWRVIAECKRRSPSRGVLRAAYDPVAMARDYERAGAAAISVLTEPSFFDGDLAHLAAVREAVALPLLRKDFIVDEYQVTEARASGADAVLLIVAALSDAELSALLAAAAATGLAALVEVHDAAELRRALDVGARIVGVNNRSLRTLEVSTATAGELVAAIPEECVAVAESGLKNGDDLRRMRDAGYDAFLIGERFVAAPDPGAALGSVLRAAEDADLARTVR